MRMCVCEWVRKSTVTVMLMFMLLVFMSRLFVDTRTRRLGNETILALSLLLTGSQSGLLVLEASISYEGSHPALRYRRPPSSHLTRLPLFTGKEIPY